MTGAETGPSPARWRLATPARGGGGLAVFELSGDIDKALVWLGIPLVQAGTWRVRELAGVDRGAVARVDERTALLMPHGGAAVIRAVAEWLRASGLEEWGTGPAAHAGGPEGYLAAALESALARAASPAAIDLLLEQPRRWRETGVSEPGPLTPAPDGEHSRLLGRLIDPPLVVAVGASNIGKSTLLNVLSGRTVSAVADEPGTTRDHVGALVDFDGVVARYVDMPGFREGADPLEVEALRIGGAVLSAADLVLRLGDVGREPPGVGLDGPSLMVAVRVDLGAPGWGHDVAVCAPAGRGIDELRRRVGEALVPRAVREAETPWRFW